MENNNIKFKMICDKCFNKPLYEWINVKEQLPDKTMSVLTYNGSFIDIGAYLIGNYFITEKGAILDVTHWMSLPESPK
jgi:hypothetical protein